MFWLDDKIKYHNICNTLISILRWVLVLWSIILSSVTSSCRLRSLRSGPVRSGLCRWMLSWSLVWSCRSTCCSSASLWVKVLLSSSRPTSVHFQIKKHLLENLGCENELKIFFSGINDWSELQVDYLAVQEKTDFQLHLFLHQLGGFSAKPAGVEGQTQQVQSESHSYHRRRSLRHGSVWVGFDVLTHNHTKRKHVGSGSPC